MKILMVCLGNICRSPLAEGILRNKVQKAGLDWIIDSAGTNHYETGFAPHKLSQNIARLNGVEIMDQRCRQFVKEDMLNFDRIYVMDQNNYYDVKRISKQFWNEDKVNFLMNEVYPYENRQIPDPYFGKEEDYKKVYTLIEQACSNIVNNYPNSAIPFKINHAG
jgi:protein-tyrosine phosphatase